MIYIQRKHRRVFLHGGVLDFTELLKSLKGT